MAKIAQRSVQKTVYPLDYDLNSKSGFNQWRDYIQLEADKIRGFHTAMAQACLQNLLIHK